MNLLCDCTYKKRLHIQAIVQEYNFLGDSTGKETRVPSLDWEDPLEKEMTTHSSIVAWRIPWTEEPGRLQSLESQRVRHD